MAAYHLSKVRQLQLGGGAPFLRLSALIFFKAQTFQHW